MFYCVFFHFNQFLFFVFVFLSIIIIPCALVSVNTFFKVFFIFFCKVFP
ncbi:hypothetical protein BE24_0223 [Staphylococcus phage vB_SepM_BE24]|nr:hypothetical protein BE24_0223 [Staphylococcus phage vB_SepM_BE24]